MLIIIFIFVGSTRADADVTAREKLDEAKAMAVNLASDAKLIFINTDSDVTLDGKAGQWMYFFKSESKNRLYEIDYDDGNISRQQPLHSWEDFQVRFQFQPLPQNWIDSDKAIDVAEANGGSDFRAARGNRYAIKMRLLPPFAMIYPVAVWDISYRSDDNYFDIQVDALTGEVYEIPRVTAREHLADVEAAVAGVSTDAELIEVFSGEMDLEGTAEEWMYWYRSSDQQTHYEFRIQGGQVVQNTQATFPDLTAMETIPDNWIDSDAAIAIAEEEGGEAFRQNETEFPIFAVLFDHENDLPRWEMDYGILGGRRFFVDAFIPVTARETLTDVNTSAVAVAADAQLIRVSTEKLNLTGKSAEWRYLYQSLSQQDLFEFINAGGNIVQSPEVTNPNPGVFLGVEPLPEDWIDSDLVVILAETSGGEAFRESQSEWNLVAELAHPDGWDAPWWALDYQCPGDAWGFQVDAVLETMSARDQLAKVNSTAQGIDPDAQLVYIRSDDVDPDGTATSWKYVYEESVSQTFYEFVVYGEYVVQNGITVTDDALQPGMVPMPLSWYDCDKAMAFAEASGGSQFRSDYSDWSIAAKLHVPASTLGKAPYTGSSQAQWSLYYTSSQANQTFTWDAGQFSDDWNAQVSGTSAHLRSVDAVSDLICWASGTDGCVLLTTDGGYTWVDASGGLDADNYFSIAAIDEMTSLIVTRESASGNAVIHRTEDSGNTWTNVYALNDAWVNGVTMFTETKGIAYGDPVRGEWLLLDTTDGGETWEKRDNAPEQRDWETGNIAFWLNESVGWLGTTMEWIYHTTDGGSTWSRVDVPGLSRINTIACDGNGNVLAASSYNRECVMRSTNNGEDWESIDYPGTDRIRHITFYNNRFWLVTGNTIYKSTTIGSAWSTEAIAYGSLRKISFTESEYYIHGWAVGDYGTIIHYTFDTTPVLESEAKTIPHDWALFPNYPNPFNPSTTIGYHIPAHSTVRLVVYNILGKRVRTLVKEDKPAGFHSILWDGEDDSGNRVNSGIYVYRIETSEKGKGRFFEDVRKMILMK